MDMPLVVILASASVSVAVVLFVVVMSRPGEHQHESVRQNLAPSSTIIDERELLLQQSPIDRAFRPAIRALAVRARRLTPLGWIESLAHRLEMAGVRRRGAVERILALKVVLGLVGAGIALWYLASGLSFFNLVASGFAVVLLYMLPDLVLLSRGRERQAAIQSELPDTLDQMTISVEAGLGFDAALRRVSDAGEGPLSDELSHTIREINLGLSRRDAFRHLVERTSVDELRQFAFAVQHADEYGLPVAQVLRIQAADLRVKRRQRAEEAALKLPVKLIFPLLLCIFPVIFIILLGPAAFRIARMLF